MVRVWRRAALLTIGWLVAAVATTAVGMAAIDTLGAGLIGQTGQDAPMNTADVQRRLAAEPTAEPTAEPVASTPASAGPIGTPSPPADRTPAPDHRTVSPRPSPATSSSPVTRTLEVRGGTVQARCDDGQVTLIAWSPDPGFHVDAATRGPATSLSVKFTRDQTVARTVITCVDGAPVARGVEHDD